MSVLSDLAKSSATPAQCVPRLAYGVGRCSRAPDVYVARGGVADWMNKRANGMNRQQRTVTTADGLALAVYVHARPDTPAHVPTVVLAHDWGLTHRSWDAVVALLATSGLRIITLDQRGHGASALGLNRKTLGDLTIDHFGRDLHAVIRALVPPSSPVVLVGHSLGGMTAMAYIGQHLKEARTRVAGAVLVSTAAVDVRLGQSGRSRLAKRLMSGGPDPYQPPVRGNNHREALFGDNPDPAAVAAVNEQVSGTDPAVLRASYRVFCQADVRQAFELLMDVPVSILTGSKDTVTPPTRSRAMTIPLTKARFATLRGAGHELPYEAPARIVDELRWVLITARDLMRARASRRIGENGRAQSPPSESP